MKTLVLPLLLTIATLISSAWARPWTAFDGRVIEADLITYSRINHEVTLKRSDGLIFHVPTKILSWKDIDYLESLSRGGFIYSQTKAFDPFDNYWDTQEYINYQNWKRAQACKPKPQAKVKASAKISKGDFTISIKL